MSTPRGPQHPYRGKLGIVLSIFGDSFIGFPIGFFGFQAANALFERGDTLFGVGIILTLVVCFFYMCAIDIRAKD